MRARRLHFAGLFFALAACSQRAADHGIITGSKPTSDREVDTNPVASSFRIRREGHTGRQEQARPTIVQVPEPEMSAIVRCPKCAVGLKVPEGFLGRLVRCPRCKEAVPTATAAPSAAVMAMPAEQASPQSREQSSEPLAQRPEAFRAEPPPLVP